MYFLLTTWKRRWFFQPCQHCYTGSGQPQPPGGSLHSRRNTVPKTGDMNSFQSLSLFKLMLHLIVIRSSASTTGVVASKAGCRTIQLALKHQCCHSFTPSNMILARALKRHRKGLITVQECQSTRNIYDANLVIWLDITGCPWMPFPIQWLLLVGFLHTHAINTAAACLIWRSG